MDSIFTTALFGVWFFMAVVFLLSLRLKNNSIVDVAWGIGFIAIALGSFVFTPHWSERSFLVTTLTIIWGVRLSARIFLKNYGKPEDIRYRRWREQWVWFKTRSFFQIYLLQGFLLWLVSIPVIMVNTYSGSGLSLLDYVGVSLWGIGFLFETVGDFQLDRFISNGANKGKLLVSGLWHYSRHPNYFGEALLWWGIFLVALSLPYGFISVVAPLTLTFLLVKVSGVPMAEVSYQGRPDFEHYRLSTNAFLPWFPKSL